MKKSLQKVISLVIVLGVVFSLNVNVIAASITDQAGQEVSSIDLPRIGTKDEVIEYTAKVSTGTENKKLIPIEVPSAGVIIAEVSGVEITKSTNVSLVRDENAADTSYIGTRLYVDNSGSSQKKFIEVSEGGTYYLRVLTSDYVSDYSPATEQTVKINLSFAPISATLKNKEERTVAGSDSNKYGYFKITVTKDSYIDVALTCHNEATYTYGFKTMLFNSKKKPYSSNTDYISNTSVDSKVGYAVKKGTYYIGVATSNDLYYIKPTITQIKETSGTSKSKAVSLTKNKAKTGLVLINDTASKADWYKFTIAKNQRVNLTLKGNASLGSIQATVYSARDNYGSTMSVSGYADENEKFYYTMGLKDEMLKAGTYYIKVTRGSRGGNGKYSIKWS